MITLVCGPVCSGKTSELLRILERAHIAKKKVVLIRPTVDTRQFLSHSYRDVSWLKTIQADLDDSVDCEEFDVIGIDEAQFQPNLSKFCVKNSLAGKNVIMAGLHASSELEMFDSIIGVIPVCDEIKKLNAICVNCGSELGSHSFYIGGTKKEKVKVGGTEQYSSLCLNCYSNERKIY